MSKIAKVLVIGSAPIVIGQATEFDCLAPRLAKVLWYRVGRLTSADLPEVNNSVARGFSLAKKGVRRIDLPEVRIVRVRDKRGNWENHSA